MHLMTVSKMYDCLTTGLMYVNIYVCVPIYMILSGKKERKKERHLRQLKNEK